MRVALAVIAKVGLTVGADVGRGVTDGPGPTLVVRVHDVATRSDTTSTRHDTVRATIRAEASMGA